MRVALSVSILLFAGSVSSSSDTTVPKLPNRFSCSRSFVQGQDGKSFWRDFVHWSGISSDSSATFLDESRPFTQFAVILSTNLEVLATAIDSCIPGVLTILLRAIPAIDYDNGRSNAISLFRIVEDIVLSLSSEESQLLSTIFNSSLPLPDGAEAEWRGDLLTATVHYFRFLFEDKPNFHRSVLDDGDDANQQCHGPPIYVYQLADTTRPIEPTEALKLQENEGTEQTLAAFFSNTGFVGCSFGMYGTETLFEKFFLHHPCRVYDPDEAKLFFVPSFFKCIEAINYFEKFRPDGKEATALAQENLNTIKNFYNGKYWRRSLGADHIFLFSWGRFPCAIDNWRNIFGRAIFLQVEDQCEHLGETFEPTFSPWKDVIVPGHLDYWRTLELARHRKPLQERDLLAVFHGRHGGIAESYENVTVRMDLINAPWADKQDVSIGGFVDGYHELLGRAQFCLCPRGITPWTVCVYQALIAGCVPVILSDHFELPFQWAVPWQDFSIRWPEQEVAYLYDGLKQIPRDQIENLWRNAQMAACAVNYYSLEPNCSPYDFVMQALTQRAATMQLFPASRENLSCL